MYLPVLLIPMLAGAFSLTPRPDVLELPAGDIPLRFDSPMVVYLEQERDEFVNARLADLALATGLSFAQGEADERAVVERGLFVGLEQHFPPFASRGFGRLLSTVADPGAGGYKIVVSDGAIVVAGADPAGLQHGWRTLVALARQTWPLPALRLSDGPAIGYRAVRLSHVDRAMVEACLAGRADAILVDGDATGLAQLGFALSLPVPDEQVAKPKAGQIMVRTATPAAAVTIDASAADAFAHLDRLSRDAGATVIIDGSNVSPDRLRDVLLHGWNPDRPVAVWEAGLGGLLGAHLEDPDATAIIDAVFAYINRASLSSLPTVRAFDASLRALEPGVPRNHRDVGLVRSVYEAVWTYLDLDQAFKREPSPALLTSLAKLVEQYTAIDPQADGERGQKIVEVISTQGVFVPPSVLFGRTLHPLATMSPPSAHSMAIAYAGEPKYSYGEREATASFSFGVPLGRICRVDYEIAGVSEIRLERSDDGETWLPAGTVPVPRGVVSGPYIASPPFSAREVRITATGSSERSTLRSAQVIVWKDAGTLALPELPMAGGTGDLAIERLPIIADGFVLDGAPLLAEAQSVLRGGRATRGLLLGIEAGEPRMATMESVRSERDGPIAERESVTFVIAANGHLYSFTVNPLGNMGDGRDEDASWNGDWRAQTGAKSASWTAIIFVPWDTLGGSSGISGVNAVRHRFNVQKERSSLVVDGAGMGDTAGIVPVAAR